MRSGLELKHRLAIVAALALAASVPALAQRPDNERPTILRDIGFDQELGEKVPLDVPFRDETGKVVRLGEYFSAGKPVVLNLVYYDCPMLCTVTLSGMASALKEMTFDAGREFEVVTISFDPREGPPQAAAKKREFMARYKRPQAEKGWHFLTGEAPSVNRITKAVGFRYTWDQATGQFAHPAGTVVLTAEGRIARYMFGVEYAPRDLRLAVVEASANRIASPVDQILLACYTYDPAAGRYSASIMKVLRLAALATVAALGIFVMMNLRRERKTRPQPRPAAWAPPRTPS
jgi:protein SCO1